jgi:hypothetical protein
MDATFGKRAQQAAAAAPSALDELVASGLDRSPVTADATAAVQDETLEQLQQKLYPKGGQPSLAVVQQELADKKATWQRSQRQLALPDGGRKAKLLIARLDRYLMLREQEEQKRMQARQQQWQEWEQGQHQGGSGDSVTVLSGVEGQQQQPQEQQQPPPANPSKQWLAVVSRRPAPCRFSHSMLRLAGSCTPCTYDAAAPLLPLPQALHNQAEAAQAEQQQQPKQRRQQQAQRADYSNLDYSHDPPVAGNKAPPASVSAAVLRYWRRPRQLGEGWLFQPCGCWRCAGGSAEV